MVVGVKAVVVLFKASEVVAAVEIPMGAAVVPIDVLVVGALIVTVEVTVEFMPRRRPLADRGQSD